MEEQRLELDQQNAELLERVTSLVERTIERDANRDMVTMQAFTSIAEGLKLLAEAIKNNCLVFLIDLLMYIKNYIHIEKKYIQEEFY